MAGHICLDIIPLLQSEVAFSPGRLVEIGPAVLSTGGAVSNTGLALHRLGIDARLMGKIADDLFGRATQQILAREGPRLAEGMILARGETSSYTIIVSPPGRDRMFLHCAGCNDTFRAADVDYAAVEAARLFHFGYPPVMRRMIERDGAELADLFRRARAAGATTSLDLTMPDPNGFSGRVDWRAILGAVLPLVDIFMPSLEELLFMLYPERYRAFSPASVTVDLLGGVGSDIVEMGPAVVGLKLGPDGLYVRTCGAAAWRDRGRGAPRDLAAWSARELWSPCFEASAVGTTGAGDATIAGFLAALLYDDGPEECVRMACAVGASSVEAADAVSGIRSWEETAARCRAGWPQRSLRIDVPGWRRAGDTGLWHGPADSARGRRV